jgi:hypothetical protein
MPQARSIFLVWTLLCSVVPFNSQAQTSNADWSRASAADSGLSEAKLRSLDAAVRSGEYKKIGSVLIARHGKLAYESYFEGDAATLRDTRSATKSITDILVGIAIDEHKLSGVDAKVLALLPERARRIQSPDPRKAEITVEDFLTMSSPLECDDWNDASRGNEERMYVVEDWAQFVLDLPIRGHMHLGEKVEPPRYGRYFSYCTGEVFTLSEVLEKVTGERTDRYAREIVRAARDHECGVGVFAPERSADGRRIAVDESGLVEDRATLSGRRALAGDADCERGMGSELDPAACADRRGHGLWIFVVVEFLQEWREVLPGILHVGKWGK